MVEEMELLERLNCPAYLWNDVVFIASAYLLELITIKKTLLPPLVGMKMGNLTNSSHAITKSLKPPCKQARSHERRALNLPNSSKASSKARNVLLKSILAKNQAGVESRAQERIIIIQRGSRVVGCWTSVSFSWSLNEASSKARNVDLC